MSHSRTISQPSIGIPTILRNEYVKQNMSPSDNFPSPSEKCYYYKGKQKRIHLNNSVELPQLRMNYYYKTTLQSSTPKVFQWTDLKVNEIQQKLKQGEQIVWSCGYQTCTARIMGKIFTASHLYKPLQYGSPVNRPQQPRQKPKQLNTKLKFKEISQSVMSKTAKPRTFSKLKKLSKLVLEEPIVSLNSVEQTRNSETFSIAGISKTPEPRTYKFQTTDATSELISLSENICDEKIETEHESKINDLMKTYNTMETQTEKSHDRGSQSNIKKIGFRPITKVMVRRRSSTRDKIPETFTPQPDSSIKSIVLPVPEIETYQTPSTNTSFKSKAYFRGNRFLFTAKRPNQRQWLSTNNSPENKAETMHLATVQGQRHGRVSPVGD